MNVTVAFIILCQFLCMCCNNSWACGRSSTKASGSFAPSRICSGALIFADNFKNFNSTKWQNEITLGGGGNWEFQWYTDNERNTAVANGVLKIKPTLTSDDFGAGVLTSTVNLGNSCTNSQWNGCSRTGTRQNILNPIRSARIQTKKSFSFKYGRVVVKAKLPAGDWLWPAIWLLPTHNVYGGWPTSGEIDIMESRGNRNLNQNGNNIGVHQMGSTLHWGPNPSHNAFSKTHWESGNSEGFNQKFHYYEVKWTPKSITFKVDGKNIGTVTPPRGGFWELGQFGRNADNPWKRGTRMAPFDQQFYLIINLAVGGTNQYFPDSAKNPGGKPWSNNSPQAITDFWNGRSQWLKTWNLGKNQDSYLQIDYVKVYAL